MHEHIEGLCALVKNAYQMHQPLSIHGGNSKSFYGNCIQAQPIHTTELNGIIEYQPSELYITALAGTPLSSIEATLAEHNQMLSFEPPHFSTASTLGGSVACGLSGPRRPYADAIRDCILGANIINGKGEHLIFGGKVMKNVAGYDVSRLMCGAFGTLGIITQLSVKVLPKPNKEITLMFELNAQQAVQQIHAWLTSLTPITACYHYNSTLWIRLSGLDDTVSKLQQQLGGELIPSCESFWSAIKNHQTDFFTDDAPLWRCIVPHNTAYIFQQGESCFEWNSGLHWIKSNATYEDVINQCASLGGHATLFRSQAKPADCFSPMNDQLKKLHLNLKQAFDPAGILNPGRMYSWC